MVRRNPRLSLVPAHLAKYGSSNPDAFAIFSILFCISDEVDLLYFGIQEGMLSCVVSVLMNAKLVLGGDYRR